MTGIICSSVLIKLALKMIHFVFMTVKPFLDKSYHVRREVVVCASFTIHFRDLVVGVMYAPWIADIHLISALIGECNSFVLD